ncbi:hypothetical protein F7734_41920 [Scytonema sp. UIC 10036]|nr:hypothetical protein [Scytonema sp. UIC 10036]MUG98506.1 hypothetical protein [Scytonema sp. UIC 10036]
MSLFKTVIDFIQLPTCVERLIGEYFPGCFYWKPLGNRDRWNDSFA